VGPGYATVGGYRHPYAAAARPGAIRELTLEDIDLPSRRISIAGHRQPLGEPTRNALLAWLGYRRDRILAEALATGADPLHLAWSSTSTTPTRWPTPTPPATFSAAPSPKTRVRHGTRNTHAGLESWATEAR
jgi:hypothetical protein